MWAHWDATKRTGCIRVERRCEMARHWRPQPVSHVEQVARLAVRRVAPVVDLHGEVIEGSDHDARNHLLRGRRSGGARQWEKLVRHPVLGGGRTAVESCREVVVFARDVVALAEDAVRDRDQRHLENVLRTDGVEQDAVEVPLDRDLMVLRRARGVGDACKHHGDELGVGAAQLQHRLLETGAPDVAGQPLDVAGVVHIVHHIRVDGLEQ